MSVGKQGMSVRKQGMSVRKQRMCVRERARDMRKAGKNCPNGGVGGWVGRLSWGILCDCLPACLPACLLIMIMIAMIFLPGGKYSVFVREICFIRENRQKSDAILSLPSVCVSVCARESS